MWNYKRRAAPGGLPLLTPSEIMQSLLLPHSSHAYSCCLISMSKKLLERCETWLIICDTMKVIFYLCYFILI